MKISIESLKSVAKHRPEGYVEDVMSRGKRNGEYLEIEPAAYRELLVKYGNKPNKPDYIIRKGCCGDTPNSGSFPPMSRQMMNAVGALGRVASASFTGNRVKASDAVIASRQAICDGCEFKKDNRCLKCGCYYKVKITLDTEHCPAGKW